ncbi:hypothetical protein [Stutzerimonas stutzeri]|uniref:hypothetical protein n=1 Tax=Stutzerimonas stutzeri TaxID=316 RepID=UPI002109A477|nr:hypothetical protein [Stutzerimonas stutzeri]MCQ4258434.1 hypothetical protein [Stutzerimonas stutzeri]
MKIRMMVMVLGLGIAAQASADSRGGVWFYQPDGGSYRVESRSQQYDPRSPYPQHRQYPQNLPPRYQGQLPPQYYERHRGSDRQHWNHERRGDARQLQGWKGERRSGLDRPQRWDRDRSNNYGRRPPVRDGRDYRTHQRHDYNGRHYRR